MRVKRLILCIVLALVTNTILAQDLLELLEKEQKDIPQYSLATFKFSRIAFGHSVETRKKGLLDIFVSNRFWNKPIERSQSFGADLLSSRIALEYGITDKLSIGFGGTTFDGLFDGYAKFKLVRQQENNKGAPFSMTLLQGASYFSEGLPADITAFGSSRFSYTTQLLLAKKFNSNLSLQISPTFVHRGLKFSENETQNHFAIGFGGRYKLGNHVSVVSEYYVTTNPLETFDTYGPFAIGVNWELGDIMLQFMLTNAVNMVEDNFITQTKNNFNFRNPNLNFGFNVSYIIHFKKGLKGD